MNNTDVYREIAKWKKPLHVSKEKIAKAYLHLLKGTKIIGITGSVGKTSTQIAIYKVLSQKYKTVVGEENLDPTFRIPATILKTKSWDKYLILEYGVEHPGEMDHYLNLVKPNIAIITKIAPTHTKYFKDIEGVETEKSKILIPLTPNDFAILNADDQASKNLAKLTRAQVIWFGKSAKKGVKISNFSQDFTGSKFRIHYGGKSAHVNWKVVGKHHLLAAYIAATVGVISGLTLKQIAKGLSQIKSPKHRLNVVTIDNTYILDDTYNSSPVAAKESLQTLVELGISKKKIAVLGEMKDLGQLSEELHRELGQKISKLRINHLITIGPIASVIAKAAEEKFKGTISEVSNTAEAIKILKNLKLSNALVLIKGSRHAHLERVVKALLGKSTHIKCNNCGNLK